MKTQSNRRFDWNTAINLLLPILVAVTFFIIVFAYYPFREKLQFDTDEGLNLMRSMLVTLGHPLYSEVSSDQPPFLTQVLALLFRFTGFEVNPARVVILLFSTLLVWSGAQFLSLTSGKLSPLLLLPLLLITPRYMDLSISVMIGIPSIALAVLSMLLMALWHRQRKEIWLILSGFALALSVLTKLFTGFMALPYVIGIIATIYFENREKGFNWRQTIRPVLVWCIAFGGLGLILGVALIGPQNVWEIIYPHVAANSMGEAQDVGNINYFLLPALPLILLGLFGSLISLYRRNWLALYSLSWAAMSYVLFTFHSPVFYHHQLMITVPLALSAAGGIGEGITLLFQLRKSADILRVPTLLGVIALVSAVLVISFYLPDLDKELMNRPRIDNFTLKATAGKLKVLETMNQYADKTNWIMTDMPIYAFRVHKPVPPIVATFSQKRLDTGSLTEEDILNAMRQYRPEQVLVARFQIPALETYIEENYKLVLDVEYYKLYIRNDLAPAAQ